MRKCILRIIVAAAVLNSSLQASAQSSLQGSSLPSKVNLSGSEFFVGGDYGKPLVTVHLLNGVKVPGVYHVPMDTNLAQLFAYAGGTTELADIASVTIRRNNPEMKLLEVDLKQELKLATQIMPVRDQDIIHIEQRVSAERTMTWVSIIASLASIALSVALIQDMRNR